MKAEDARKLTEVTRLSDDYIKLFLQAVYKKIEAAAIKGERIIYHPFDSLTTQPTHEQRIAIKHRLTEDGYTVKDHPDPDPGHPTSRPYTSVEW